MNVSNCVFAPRLRNVLHDIHAQNDPETRKHLELAPPSKCFTDRDPATPVLPKTVVSIPPVPREHLVGVLREFVATANALVFLHNTPKQPRSDCSLPIPRDGSSDEALDQE